MIALNLLTDLGRANALTILSFSIREHGCDVVRRAYLVFIPGSCHKNFSRVPGVPFLYANEMTGGLGPLESFRGVGSQKDQGMIRGLELSAFPHP